MSAERRSAVLAEAFALMRLIDGPGKGEATTEQQQRLEALRDAYRTLVPVVPMSRCPFTNAVFKHSFDPYGVDGLWWDHDHPVRPHEELPDTFLALTGALAPRGAFEVFPFVAYPGAAAPFVVPRLLEAEGVTAVVSGLPCGKHLAFPIVYFARSVPRELQNINDWGANSFAQRGRPGSSGNRELAPNDIDFDLKTWLARGKLMWIAPGDSALRSSADGCPYLDLNRGPGLYRVQNGKFAPLDQPDPTPTRTNPTCASCGAEVTAKMKFCGECGAVLSAAPAAAPQVSPQIAAQPSQGGQSTFVRSWFRAIGLGRNVESVAPADAVALAAALRALRDSKQVPEQTFAKLHQALRFLGPEETEWTVGLGSLQFNKLVKGAWVPSEPPQFLFLSSEMVKALAALPATFAPPTHTNGSQR